MAEGAEGADAGKADEAARDRALTTDKLLSLNGIVVSSKPSTEQFAYVLVVETGADTTQGAQIQAILHS